MSDQAQTTTARDCRPFIPASLDDFGLTPPQFRVLCHLHRRAGSNGDCYPAAHSIAKTCKIHRDTVWKCIKELESAKLIKRSKGRRNSNRYHILASIPVGGKQGPTQANELAESEGQELAESKGRELAESKGRKGYPHKGNQRRVSIPGGISSDPLSEKKPRQRNAILDALASIDGSDPLQVPAKAWGGIAAALADIKTVCPELTIIEINRRSANYRLHHRDVTISPHALAKHWAKCDRKPTPAGRGILEPRFNDAF
jgi:DNA-binding MarR family transcriptional regulator